MTENHFINYRLTHPTRAWQCFLARSTIGSGGGGDFAAAHRGADVPLGTPRSFERRQGGDWSFVSSSRARYLVD